MERKRIYLSCPTMHGEEQMFVQEAFDTNWVAPLGPNVDKFEKEVAAYAGIGHAAALASGTAAIHLAVKLAGVEAGDVVFVQSLTFSASVNPVCYEKAIPVFIDSEDIYVCENCANEYFTVCADCGEYFRKDKIVWIDDTPYCEDCAEEYTSEEEVC